MDGLSSVTNSLNNQESNRAEWHRLDFNSLKQGQTKLYEMVSEINTTLDKECKGCSAKDRHIQTLEKLLDRESHYFHDLNRSVHASTGIVAGNTVVSGNKVEDVPVGRGTTSFEDLRQRAEEASRKLARERNPEADKVENHWRGKGATSMPGSNTVQPNTVEIDRNNNHHPMQKEIITNIEEP